MTYHASYGKGFAFQVRSPKEVYELDQNGIAQLRRNVPHSSKDRRDVSDLFRRQTVSSTMQSGRSRKGGRADRSVARQAGY